jgi:hypothetical protein
MVAAKRSNNTVSNTNMVTMDWGDGPKGGLVVNRVMVPTTADNDKTTNTHVATRHTVRW